MRNLIFLLAALLLLTMPVAAQDDPSITILYPLPVYDVAGTVEIVGTVNPPNLQSYFLETARYDPAAPDALVTWIPVALPTAQTVTEDVLAQWNTTTVTDGLYQLRLQVLLQTGETRFVTVAPLRVANGSGVASTGDTSTVPLTVVTPAVPNLQPDTSPGVVVPPAQATSQLIPTLTPPPPPAEPTPEVIARPDPVNELPLPVGGHISGFNESTVELIEDAGLTWIKWQVPFFVGDDSLIDVARDRINWTHERGFLVFLSIKGDKDEMAELGFDAYFPLYAEFVGRVAELQPDAIQVWNEMNLDREWPNGQIDPVAYTDLLRQSYEAIKAVDPEVRVVTGAPAPTGAEGAFGLAAVWNDDRYYRGMANAGAADVSDCIGVHYNEGVLAPNQRGGDPRDNDYPTRYLLPMLERAEFPFRGTGARFCFSELGYVTPEGYPGDIPAGFEWARFVSLEEQATWLRDAIQLLADNPIPVDLVIIWNLDFASIAGDPQGAYAIVRPDGSCPACATIADLRN